MRFTALSVLILVAVPAAALAQSSQVTVTGKKKDPREDRKDKVTCKTYSVTGSLASTKRVCMSASDWRQEREDIQRFNSEHGTTCTSPGGCN